MDPRLRKLDDELFQMERRVAERARLQRRLTRMEKALVDAGTRLDQARAALTKEAADVRTLEDASLEGVLQRLAGNHEADMAQEREEQVAATLRMYQCSQTVKDLNGHVVKLQSEVTTLGAYVERRDFLLREKEQLLEEISGAHAHAVFDNSQRALVLADGVSGSRHAISTGRAVMTALEDLVDNLSHAARTDLWDLNGDGLISQPEKFATIERVTLSVTEAESLLRDFAEQVEDITGQPGVDIDIKTEAFDELGKLVLQDFYLDWIVESKANSAIEQTLRTAEQVKRTLDDLERWFKRSVLQSSLLSGDRAGLFRS